MIATVYTMPMCQPCNAVKRWLDQKGVKYEEKDAREHLDYLREIGVQASPVMTYGDVVVTGFQPAKLKELFG